MATNATFVTTLYQNMLGRTPSAAEQNYWVGKLTFNELSQAAVAQTILGSAEAQSGPASVVRLYQTYFGRLPSVSEINYYAVALNTGARSLGTIAQQFSLSPEFTARFGSGNDNTAFVQSVYSNVLGRSASATEVAYYNARLAAGETRGAIALSFNESPEFKTNYAPTVNVVLINAGVTGTVPSLTTVQQEAAANLNTLTTSLIANGPNNVTAASFALTTGVDNLVGTDGNNIFDASRAVLQGQVLDSLGNADQIDGGLGTDTLLVQMTLDGGNAATTKAPASLKNVEIVSLEVLNTNGATLNLINGDSAITTVRTANNVGAASITNINSAPTAYEISTTGSAFSAGVTTSKLAGTADAATLTLTNVTNAGAAVAVTIGNSAATGGNGYETFNIVSNGSAANVITLDDTFGGAAVGSLATINITGANNLTLGSVANLTSVTKVDATAYTGALTYTAAAGNGQAMTVTGGTGNDIIDVQGYTTADTINGGTGTDRLVLTNAQATGATATQSNVSGIEIIRLSDTTDGTVIAVNNFGGATGLQLGAAVNHTSNVLASYAAGTNSFDRQASTDNANETTTLTVAGVATTDVMNVTLGTTTAASTWDGTGAFTINGAETVNITTQGGAATIGGALTLTDTAASEAIVITGSQSLTITGAVRADSINASGMTGTAALVLTGGTSTTATAITGTANGDTLIGSTAADIINGGAGNDLITNTLDGANTTAGDVLTGGTGFDTFTLIGSSASAATYAGAPNITDFTVGELATNTDFIRLSSTNASYSAGLSVTGTAAGASGAVGVQTLAQNGTGAAAVGMEFLKLTTGVAAGASLQATFDAAIGTGTITAATAGVYAGSLFDTTNNKMVIFEVNSAGGTGTIIEAADTVRLIGTIDMTAANYALIDTDNFAAFL